MYGISTSLISFPFFNERFGWWLQETMREDTVKKEKWERLWKSDDSSRFSRMMWPLYSNTTKDIQSDTFLVVNCSSNSSNSMYQNWFDQLSFFLNFFPSFPFPLSLIQHGVLQHDNTPPSTQFATTTRPHEEPPTPWSSKYLIPTRRNTEREHQEEEVTVNASWVNVIPPVRVWWEYLKKKLHSLHSSLFHLIKASPRQPVSFVCFILLLFSFLLHLSLLSLSLLLLYLFCVFGDW